MALLVANVPLVDGVEPVETVADHLQVSRGRVLKAVLVRKSLDARHGRQVWRGAFKVEAEDEDGLVDRRPGVRRWKDKDEVRYGLRDATPARRIWDPAPWIVVGAGPAGMFAALYLAEAGASVVLLERGGPVRERVKTVNAHWRRKLPLDADDNLVFGEGGAGTFSDGKIYTRRRDGDVGYVLRRFVDFGARPDILQEGWAHLGTDKVRAILPVFRERLRELGVEVRFHARVDDLVVEDGRCVGVVLGNGEVVSGAGVIAAPGHSARDTISMLVARGAEAERRPIAIGARIEHPQALIDRARYGDDDRGDLPASSYRLAWNGPDGAKARTFCMCPGGMVVPAMSRPDEVVVNGMSFAAQRSYWANSAVIVEVEPSMYPGEGPLAGYAFQQEIERRAHDLGGGDGAAPSQRVVDLLAHRASEDLPKVSYPLGARAADLGALLPGVVTRRLVAALQAFDRKLPGFVGPEAVLIAPETRTTSPVRLLRDRAFVARGLPGLVPVGEGAGYGGGIVSCALDGLRAARAIVEAHGRPQHEAPA